MSREIDVRVAEAMGWHWDDGWGCLIPPEQKASPEEMWTDWQYDGDDGSWWKEPIPGTHVNGVVYNGSSSKIILPEYRTSIAAARAMEDWIEEHGDPIRYAVALGGIVEQDWRETDTIDMMPWADFMRGRDWRLAHATPGQRCRAFLAAMEATCEPS